MILVGIVEKFPRQVGKGRDIREAQANSQPMVFVDACSMLPRSCAIISPEKSRRKAFRQFLRRLQFGSVHAAHGAAHLPDTAQEIGDFNFGEGQRELRGWLVRSERSANEPGTYCQRAQSADRNRHTSLPRLTFPRDFFST